MALTDSGPCKSLTAMDINDWGARVLKGERERKRAGYVNTQARELSPSSKPHCFLDFATIK